MARIFIAYRRTDSQHISGRIYDHLSDRFKGSVFIDVDSIPPGQDWRKRITDEMRNVDVLLVLIGDRWLDCKDRSGVRRLDAPDDTLRTEIEVALQSNVAIIPLLVGSLPMPQPDELPASISDLAYRNAMPVRPDPDFRRDIARLIEEILRVGRGRDGGLLPLRGKKPSPQAARRARLALIAGLPVLIVAAALLGWMQHRRSPDSSSRSSRAGAPPTGLFFARDKYLPGIGGRADSVLFLRLSRPVDPLSATPQAVRLLDPGGQAVPIEVSAREDRIGIRPVRDLAAGTEYRLVLDRTLRSVTGDSLAADSGSALQGATLPITTRKAGPPAAAALDVPVSESRARIQVEVNGRVVGTAPLRGVSIPSGQRTHVVLWGLDPVSAFRVQIAEDTFTAAPGETHVWSPAVRAFGSISVASRPPGRVFVDGRDTRETTPLVGYVLLAGSHVLRIRSETAPQAEITHSFDLAAWSFGQRLGSFALK